MNRFKGLRLITEKPPAAPASEEKIQKPPPSTSPPPDWHKTAAELVKMIPQVSLSTWWKIAQVSALSVVAVTLLQTLLEDRK